MKKNFSLKSFLSGMVVTALIFGCMTTVVAANRQKQATLDYPGIKISLNGQTVTAKTASGATVEPFSIDGTTYLPVRGVASILGVDVGWDQKTKTVLLTTEGSAAVGTKIMDKNGVVIYYNGIEKADNYIGDYNIKLKIVNNSDKAYIVQVRNLSVNGIMADSIFSSNVAAGKTANDEIVIYNMDESGITAPITSAEFNFHVFNNDDWTDAFDSATINI